MQAGLLLWLAMRVSDDGRDVPLWEWGALGLAAAAALTRPEGTLYAGLALLGWGRTPARAGRGVVAGGHSLRRPGGRPLSSLWGEFGVLSPSGWLRIASLAIWGRT